MKLLINLFFLAITSIFVAQEHSEKINLRYTETKKVDTVTNYFGTDVKDPYRWLEDDRSEETKAWVETQNEVTFNYLDKIPFRKELKKRLTSIWNYEKVGAPFKEGDYTYFRKNDGLQNQSVIYRYKTLQGPSKASVFLDPNTFKEDGTISLGNISFSKNGKIAAYTISEGGSDWRKVLGEVGGSSVFHPRFRHLVILSPSDLPDREPPGQDQHSHSASLTGGPSG